MYFIKVYTKLSENNQIYNKCIKWWIDLFLENIVIISIYEYIDWDKF